MFSSVMVLRPVTGCIGSVVPLLTTQRSIASASLRIPFILSSSTNSWTANERLTRHESHCNVSSFSSQWTISWTRSLATDSHRNRKSRKGKDHRKQDIPAERVERIEDNAADCIPPEVQYSVEELQIGLPMLKRILSDLKMGGTEYVMALNDEDVVDRTLEPFRHLIRAGVLPQLLVYLCSTNPELFKYLTTRTTECIKIVDILTDSGFLRCNDALKTFTGYCEHLLSVGPDGVISRIDALVSCGATSEQSMRRIIRNCPAVLFGRDPQEMRKLVESLNGFFSRKEIGLILLRCPQVLLKSIEEVEEKYEYMYYQMCIEGSDFTQSARWADRPLEDIIRRHEFLLKTGKYTTPDVKRPQAKMENPELHRILDSTDNHFAVQVAGVTLEEWLMYLALCDKQESLLDKERPFERIKPSMRKAFERRYKERVEKSEHVFDSASASD